MYCDWQVSAKSKSKNPLEQILLSCLIKVIQKEVKKIDKVYLRTSSYQDVQRLLLARHIGIK